MTGTVRSSEGLDVRRRKILFRSWHRGMRELDLVLGSFADARIADLTVAELEQYERLLDVPDQELLGRITGERIIPEDDDAPLFRTILSFRETMTF